MAKDWEAIARNLLDRFNNAVRHRTELQQELAIMRNRNVDFIKSLNLQIQILRKSVKTNRNRAEEAEMHLANVMDRLNSPTVQKQLGISPNESWLHDASNHLKKYST